MRPIPHFPAHLVTFTEDIFNEKFIFCAVCSVLVEVMLKWEGGQSQNREEHKPYFHHLVYINKRLFIMIIFKWFSFL